MDASQRSSCFVLSDVRMPRIEAYPTLPRGLTTGRWPARSYVIKNVRVGTTLRATTGGTRRCTTASCTRGVSGYSTRSSGNGRAMQAKPEPVYDLPNASEISRTAAVCSKRRCAQTRWAHQDCLNSKLQAVCDGQARP